MQNNSPRRDDHEVDAGRQAADREIDDRLVAALRANAIKAGPAPSPTGRRPARGFFAEAYALVALVGLMIVAYLYARLVDREA